MICACLFAVFSALAGSVLDDLRAAAASSSYYWCWTRPWVPSRVVGYLDTRYAVSVGGRLAPAPVDRVRLEGTETRLLGAQPKFYIGELGRLVGTWRTDGFYATNRVSEIALVRRAWREFRSVPVYTWHNDHPCCTNGFARDPVRFHCRQHPNVLRAIVRDEQWPCGRETVQAGLRRAPSASPREWFRRELRDIASFLAQLTDERGQRIPVIIRYPHEMDGKWFWWGRNCCTPADYVGVCRLMADELRSAGVAGQVLFAYTPDRKWTSLGAEGDGQANYLSWYPGDGYVDIVGFDDYSIGAGATTDECDRRNAETLAKMRLLSAFADAHGKVAVISESGWAHVPWSPSPAQDDFYTRANRLMTAPDVHFAVFTTWSGERTIPTTEAGRQDLRKFASLPSVRLIR